MLDTIRASAQVEIVHWQSLSGWQYNKVRDYKHKMIRLSNGATIFLQYFFASRSLTLFFSASKVQHGSNAVPYDFNKAYVVKDIIDKTVNNELNIDLTTDNFNVCRVDINRDFSYNDEQTAEEVMKFAKKIIPARCEKWCDYPTGFTSRTKRDGLRGYRKDKDPKMQGQLEKPTIRFEFQMSKKKIKRIVGFRPDLSTILTKEVLLIKAWNLLLKERGLDNPISSQSELYRKSRKYLSNSLRTTLHQMNENPSFSDKDQRTKQLAVIRKMKKARICPYSCEVPIDLTVNICNAIKNNAKEGLLCFQQYAIYISYPVKDAIAEKWYLDTS